MLFLFSSALVCISEQSFDGQGRIDKFVSISRQLQVLGSDPLTEAYNNSVAPQQDPTIQQLPKLSQSKYSVWHDPSHELNEFVICFTSGEINVDDKVNRILGMFLTATIE